MRHTDPLFPSRNLIGSLQKGEGVMDSAAGLLPGIPSAYDLDPAGA